MKHIFYFIAILFMIKEMHWILNPVKEAKKSRRLKKLTKKFNGKKWDDYSQEYKDLLIWKGLPGLLLLFWAFSGILSFNWVAFLIFLIIQFTFIYPINRMVKNNLLYISIHWLNSVFGFVFSVFVIINSYHLKIDLYQLVTNYLK